MCFARMRPALAVLTASLAFHAGCEQQQQPQQPGEQQQPAKPINPPLPPDAPGPNILFVLVDTLRADRLGCYGHERKLSPTIDSIASEGVVFEQAVAQSPWTQPSMASLFTGMYPGALLPVLEYRLSFGAVRAGAEMVRVLEDRHVTLPEVLRDAGYTTAAIVTNPYIVAGFGFDQGFDHFDGDGAWTPTPGDVVNQAADKWLHERDLTKPFFLYLHYMDVHGPYDAAPRFLDPLLDEVDKLPEKHVLSEAELKNILSLPLGRPPKVHTDLPRHERLNSCREYWEARYEAGIAEFDYLLGRLRDRLREVGLWDDLTVIITSDHGEALCEHHYWEHGYNVRHTELHVPLIVRWPDELPAGKRVPVPVRVMDVMPTIIDQLDLAPAAGLQSVSLLPYIDGSAIEPLAALAEGLKVGPEYAALYFGEWKLVVPSDSQKQFLFLVQHDPLERKNFAEEQPQILELLQERMVEIRAFNSRLAATASRERVPLTPAQIEHLRALGYTGGG